MSDPRAAEEPPLPPSIGSWSIVRLLGRGGMAVVYEGVGPEGERRAIKLLRAAGPSEELERRFRREFRTLSRLQHPNIARVYDWGQEDGRPYFVMELLAGLPLRDEVEAWASIPPATRFERARSVLVQVARALEYVHLRGLVHRDVTPANIMVLPDGTVRLMDFGVVKGAEPADATVHGEVLGTVAFVAPEQITGGLVDARTDLYSLGAVLYFMLTGRRPFNARTAAGYLDKHLHAAPRPPHELVPGVPEVLEQVCLRLLQKEPADRFASAAHLLHVLEGGAHSPVTLDAVDWPPSVAGRSEQVAALINAVTACQEGRGGVIFLSGGTGLGKSRLLRLAVGLATRVGIPAFKLRPVPGQGPLHALRPLVDALAAERPPLPPVLARFYDPDTRTPMERFEVYAGFREVLGGRGPRLIAVDDLHVGDAVSIELMEYLIRTITALGGEPLLWVLAATPGVQDLRLEGLAHGATLEITPQHLQLRPLDASAVEELVLSVVLDDPAARALAARLYRESEGRPALVAEMLRGLRDEGVLAPEGDALRLTVEEAAVESLALPIPRSVREGFQTRLAAMPGAARAVVEVLAVAGQELPADIVADTLDLAFDDTLGALDALVGAGLVRERMGGVDDHYELAQPRQIDLVLSDIAPDRRRDLHRRLGLTLERSCRRQLHLVVEALARHFEGGEVPAKAFHYLVAAGQRLQGRSFVPQAAECYTRAIALSEAVRVLLPLEEADRRLCEALLLRAETSDHLGHPAERLADVRAADDLARQLGDERLLSRATAALGGIARRSEDVDRAESLLLDALRLAERVGDPALRVLPLQGLGGVRWARRDLDGARRWWTELLQLGDARGDDRALAYGYNGLGLAALSRGDAADARRNFERAVEVLERLGLLGALSAARVNLVEIHHFTGNLRRGVELAERIIAHARETRHRLGSSRGRCFRSLLLVDLGRPEEALEDALEAVAIARELGDGDEEVACQVNAIRAAWATGDADRARRSLDEMMPVIAKHDAEGFLPLAYVWWARLAVRGGDPDEARGWLERVRAVPGARWPYQECRLDLSLARVYAALGERAEAWRRADVAIRRADACGFRFYSLKGHCLAATCADDEAIVARHRRVADALARSLVANLGRDDAERFLAQGWIAPHRP